MIKGKKVDKKNVQNHFEQKPDEHNRFAVVIVTNKSQYAYLFDNEITAKNFVYEVAGKLRDKMMEEWNVPYDWTYIGPCVTERKYDVLFYKDGDKNNSRIYAEIRVVQIRKP